VKETAVWQQYITYKRAMKNPGEPRSMAVAGRGRPTKTKAGRRRQWCAEIWSSGTQVVCEYGGENPWQNPVSLVVVAGRSAGVACVSV